jgi:predicted membrane protein
MLLKGGFLYVTPFIIIILRAIYLGFFKSNNDLLKALASYIFVYFVMMVSYNLPSFTTDYIFVWISVTACFTASLRNHSDNEVYQALNSRFK